MDLGSGAKMIIISHRGNRFGPDETRENSPSFIDEAIAKGFSVEIDLRLVGDELYLGHDGPQYDIDLDWLQSRRTLLWIHAKNREAFEYCLKHNLHTFFHDKDDYTMTSWGYVWAYPGKLPVGSLCIGVMPEHHFLPDDTLKMSFLGICTDFPELLKDPTTAEL